MTKVLFIAEAGVNHNGNINLAKKMIKIAKVCGADFVKFQTYDCDNLLLKDAKKAPYQIKNTDNINENQYLMLKKYQLSYSDHIKLIKECKKNKIKFISSPFDNVKYVFNPKSIPMVELPTLSNFIGFISQQRIKNTSPNLFLFTAILFMFSYSLDFENL